MNRFKDSIRLSLMENEITVTEWLIDKQSAHECDAYNSKRDGMIVYTLVLKSKDFPLKYHFKRIHDLHINSLHVGDYTVPSRSTSFPHITNCADEIETLHIHNLDVDIIDLSDIKKVDKINIDNCKFNDLKLPTSVDTLWITYCDLTDIPPSIEHCEIETLWVTNCGLEKLTHYPKNIRVLDVEKNNIKTLRFNLPDTIEMKNFGIKNNLITNLKGLSAKMIEYFNESSSNFKEMFFGNPINSLKGSNIEIYSINHLFSLLYDFQELTIDTLLDNIKEIQAILTFCDNTFTPACAKKVYTILTAFNDFVNQKDGVSLKEKFNGKPVKLPNLTFKSYKNEVKIEYGLKLIVEWLNKHY